MKDNTKTDPSAIESVNAQPPHTTQTIATPRFKLGGNFREYKPAPLIACTNQPPSGRQTCLNNRNEPHARLDRFVSVITLHCTNNETLLNAKTVLTEKKLLARQIREESVTATLPSGQSLQVYREGATKGPDGKGRRYEFVLHVITNFKILVKYYSPKKRQDDICCELFVQINGDCYLQYPEPSLRSLLLTTIDSLGCVIANERVSSCDVCMDFPGMPLTPFVDALKRDQVVCASFVENYHKSNGETIGFGALDNLYFMLYDKLAEVTKSPHKLELMKQLEWGGTIPESAVRGEFKIRRPKLAEYGVETYEDLMEKLPTMIHDFTNKYIAFKGEPVDRDNGHQSRAKNLPEWDVIKEGFQRTIGEPDNRHREPIAKPVDHHHMVISAAGMLAKSLAALDREVKARRDVEQWLIDINLAERIFTRL